MGHSLYLSLDDKMPRKIQENYFFYFISGSLSFPSWGLLVLVSHESGGLRCSGGLCNSTDA